LETLAYVSELEASRITREAEIILEVKYMLPSLGMALDDPASMLEDNMSVVLNFKFPSSE
jgi:hypothetical protein